MWRTPQSCKNNAVVGSCEESIISDTPDTPQFHAVATDKDFVPNSTVMFFNKGDHFFELFVRRETGWCLLPSVINGQRHEGLENMFCPEVCTAPEASVREAHDLGSTSYFSKSSKKPD